ncbi:Uncharacterised protein [Mycobacteroides abscessus subsp. abscessus]|nr:Uncharacterised protein [Mycobacteroides abscessus subsp. abscessus]
MPVQAASASATSAAGDGKRMLAATPSRPPADTPSTADRRWVSQRSTPLAGTATTSA